MQEELRTSGLLVGLADRPGARPHPFERPQEAPVGLVAPAHVTRSPPTGLAETVQAAVITDAEVRVGLDVVAGECAELRPGVEKPRPTADDIGNGITALLGRRFESVLECGECIGGFGREHGLGKTALGEIDVGHAQESTERAIGSIARVSDDEPMPGSAPDSGPPKPPMRLLLVRHAVTAHTGPILSGRMPGINLSDQGREQADATAARLAKLPIAAIYASPITRTQQTAAAIAAHHSLPVQTIDGVVEAEYGDWTGGEIKELAKTPQWKVVQAAPSRARFPGGESIQEMQARTVGALDALVAAHPHEMVLVVSHADPIKSAIAHYTGVHLDLFQRIHVSPASVTVLEFHAFGVMLVKSNDTGSLDELLPPEPASSP